MEEYKRKIFEATLCERSERYEEMVSNMKDATVLASENGLGFDLKAHNLFSVAYKNLAGSRRASWRVLGAEKGKYEGKELWKTELVQEHLTKVEKELCAICSEALSVIDKYILNSEDVKNNKESVIFFLKMKGDYYRYKAEVEQGEDLKLSTQGAEASYGSAFNLAEGLAPTSPVKLGLALNYSVFLYEILKKIGDACELAKNSFDMAINELDKLSEEHYKDSTLIMQLLRDNLTLWTSNNESQDNIADQDEMEPQQVGDEQ